MRARLIAMAVCLATTSRVAASQGTPAPSPQPAPASRGRILGVYDLQSGLPMEGVEVSDMLSGTSALTTSTGTVSLVFLPAGGSMVRVRKIGYQPQTILVSTAPQDTASITVVLERMTELAPIVTSDSSPRYMSSLLRGFEERRREGMGHFVAEAQLRKEDARPLENIVMANIPGVRVEPTRGGARVLRSARGGCTVPIYLDGIRLTGMSADFRQLEPATNYAAIEFYNTAEVPPQFNTTANACGVLLLWTREK